MARTSTLQAKIRPALRCAIYIRGGCACAWCGTSLNRRLLTIDHVVPRTIWRDLIGAVLGLDRPDNLVPACSECNWARGSGGERALARRLRALGGRSLRAAWLEVIRQIEAPIDREAGRKLAANWYPWESRRVAGDNGRRREASREALGEGLGGDAFPFGALACAGSEAA